MKRIEYVGDKMSLTKGSKVLVDGDLVKILLRKSNDMIFKWRNNNKLQKTDERNPIKIM